MTPLINTGPGLIATILVIIAFSLWFAGTKVGKNIGPALCVILIGLILHNVGVVPNWHDCFGPIISYCIPIAISVLMMSVDFSSLKKLGGQPLLSMFFAMLSVSIVAVIFGTIFAGDVNEGWKVSGMFVGTYTGGSANLTAIALALDASNDTIAAANAADYVIGMPSLLIFFMLPRLLKKWSWFQKKWPYSYTDEELAGTAEGAKNVGLGAKEASIFDIALLLAIGLVINIVSSFIAGKLFGSSFQSAGKMLFLTTISLLVAQIPAVKKIRFKYDVGMMISLGYLCIIGFMIDIPTFLSSTVHIAIFCFCVIVGGLLLHVILCRLFKIRYQYVLLSIVAGVADGITSSLVAVSGGWYSLAGAALLCGMLGQVCGNYLGVGVGYLVRMIAGV